jgi:hypothetical protein
MTLYVLDTDTESARFRAGTGTSRGRLVETTEALVRAGLGKSTGLLFSLIAADRQATASRPLVLLRGVSVEQPVNHPRDRFSSMCAMHSRA